MFRDTLDSSSRHGGHHLSLGHNVDVNSVDAELEQRLRDAYDQNGVDLTLVRASLAMSPADRLAALEQRVSSLQDLLAARDSATR